MLVVTEGCPGCTFVGWGASCHALSTGVMRYLSDFVRQTFIPYLSGQTNTRLRKILEDKDALAPVQTDRKAPIKLPNKGQLGRKRIFSHTIQCTIKIEVCLMGCCSADCFHPPWSPLPSAVTVTTALPSQGAREVLDLLRSLHVYTSQLPQHGEQISQILQVALLSYVRR